MAVHFSQRDDKGRKGKPSDNASNVLTWYYDLIRKTFCAVAAGSSTQVSDGESSRPVNL